MDFKNNWSDFLLPNQSRDGSARIAPIQDGLLRWQWIRNVDNAPLDTGWSDSTAPGLKPKQFWGGAQPKEWVFEGEWFRPIVDEDGNFTSDYSRDIWFFSPAGNEQEDWRAMILRRLVTNARVIDWL